ncbi:hypothetical protein Tco_1577413 [Tanacetum coccineum]
MSTKKPVSEKNSTKKSHEIQYESLEIPLESFEILEKSPEIQYESLEIPCKSHSESHEIQSESHEIQSASHEIQSAFSNLKNSAASIVLKSNFSYLYLCLSIVDSYDIMKLTSVAPGLVKLLKNEFSLSDLEVIHSESHEIPLESQEIPFTSINVSLLLESQGSDDGGDVRVSSMMMVVMVALCSDDDGDVFR